MYCRVMEEIEEVVGDKTTVEADDLDKLTYMHQVILLCHAVDVAYLGLGGKQDGGYT